MKTLIKFEFAKLLKRKTTIIFLSIFWIALILILPLNASSEYGANNEMELIIKQAKKIEGYYTYEELQKINMKMADLHERNQRELANDKTVKKLSESEKEYYFERIIVGGFEIPLASESIANEIRSGDLNSLYSNLEIRSLNFGVLKNFKLSKKELSTYATMYDIQFKKSREGHYLGYDEGWNFIVNSISKTVSLFLLGILIICVAPVFADEYSGGAVSILHTTKKGKNQLILGKFISAILFSILVYVVTICIVIAFTKFRFGLDGFRNFMYDSIDCLSFLNTFKQIIIVGIFCILAVVTITLLISAWSKNAYIATIISLLIIFFPCLPIGVDSLALLKGFALFPANLMNHTVSAISIPFLYTIGNTTIKELSMGIGFNIILIIGGIIGGSKLYINHQV